MRLLHSATSPYVRKVRMTLIETGQADQVELVPGIPLGDAEQAAAVRRLNPLGKIPALVLETGEVLYDSPVICEYLIRRAGADALLPADGPARWTALRRQALGDGVADAAFSIVMEHRRPADQRSTEWLDRWTTSIHSAADAVELELAGKEIAFDLGGIALAAAFGYVAFRLPGVDWRAGRPGLAAWFAGVEQRAGFVGTAPPQA
jgi:glutathione S-transferase